MLTIIELDRKAVEASVDLAANVTRADLTRDTPCEGWTLGDLLAHMAAQHRGFAAAAEGTGAEREHWAVRPLGDDPAKEYAEAAAEVIAAFAQDGVLQRPFAAPELSVTTTFPGSQAIGFHFIDYVIHSWDVARSLGKDYEPEDALLQPALQIATAVPDGPERLRDGAPFRPSVPDPGGDDRTWHRILRMLGRDPR
jgi:uncharacterized protein (TIGR03086 family)